MREIVSFCLFLFLTVGLFGQYRNQELIDSLYSEIRTEDTQEEIVKLEVQILNAININSHDSAIALADELLEKYNAQDYKFGQGRILRKKAWFVMFQANYEKGIKLAHEALEIATEIKDSTVIAYSLNTIGLANLQFKRYDDTKTYLLKALPYFLKMKDTVGIDIVYNNLGICAGEEGKYEEGIAYYHHNVEIRKKQKRFYWVGYSYYNLAGHYRALNQMDSAGKYYDLSKKVFLTQTKNKKIPALVKLGLGEYHLKRGDYKESIKWSKKSIEEAEEMGNYEIQMSGAKLVAEAYYQLNDYKQAYDWNDKFITQKVYQDSINNAIEIAQIEELHENEEKEKQIVKLEAENLKAKNSAQRSRVFLLSAVIIVLALVFIFGYIQVRKSQERKVDQAEQNSKLAESKLMALRAQMNPHFVFNSINTAQSLVLNSNKQDSYEFLSKFAKLLRRVLENSATTFVPLEDELEQLRLYVELEALRFSDKFTFEISVDEALENGVVEIPSMILQPFVENAIVHGLVNLKERDGLLKIDLIKENEVMICTIEDNGVGRKRSREIKQQKEKYYKSVAIPNTSERLKILREITSENIQIELIDLEEDGVAVGTKIILHMPLR